MKKLRYVNNDSISDKVIVLDVDETLIHTLSDELTRQSSRTDLSMEVSNRLFEIEIEYDQDDQKIKDNMIVLKRPHLDKFLNFCRDYFRAVIIWSAGRDDYVDKIVEKIFTNYKPNLVYARSDLDEAGGKSLRKMIAEVPGLSEIMSLENCLLVDDRSYNFDSNPDNGILIPAFNPRKTYQFAFDDVTLLQIIDWFKRSSVINQPDLRTISKSNIFVGKPLEYLNKSFEIPDLETVEVVDF